MTIKFITVRANFTGTQPDGAGTITTTISTQFPTNITQLTAVLQGFKLAYPSERYVKAASALITNTSFNQLTATCNISLQIYQDDEVEQIDPSISYADVVFIAECQ